MPVQEIDHETKDLPDISLKDWLAEGEKLFGPDKRNWKFICPNCGHIQSAWDFIELNKKGISNIKADEVVAFSCIGRFDTRIPEDKIGTIFDNEPKRQPCNYTNGGLFCFAPRMVIDEEGRKHAVFDFARGNND